MFYFADAHNIFLETFVAPTVEGLQFTAIRGSCYLKPKQFFKEIVDIAIPVPSAIDDISLLPLSAADNLLLFRDCLLSFPRLKSDSLPIDEIGLSNVIFEIRCYKSLEDFLEQREMPIEYLIEQKIPVEMFKDFSFIILSYPLPSFFQGQELSFSIAYTHPMEYEELFAPSSLAFNSVK